MKKLELTLIGIAIFGLILKLLEVSFAGTILIISLTTLAIVYYMLAFALFKEVPFNNILKKENLPLLNSEGILSRLTPGLPLAIAVTGLLFKIQTWPYAGTLLLVGSVGLFIVIIIYIFKLRKETKRFNTNMIKRVIIAVAICIFVSLIPHKNWLTWNYPNHPEFVKAAVDYYENQDNREYFEKYIEERKKMIVDK